MMYRKLIANTEPNRSLSTGNMHLLREIHLIKRLQDVDELIDGFGNALRQRAGEPVCPTKDFNQNRHHHGTCKGDDLTNLGLCPREYLDRVSRRRQKETQAKNGKGVSYPILVASIFVR